MLVILILGMGRVDGHLCSTQEILAELKRTDKSGMLLMHWSVDFYWGLIINTHLQLCKGWLKIPLKWF